MVVPETSSRLTAFIRSLVAHVSEEGFHSCREMVADIKKFKVALSNFCIRELDKLLDAS